MLGKKNPVFWAREPLDRADHGIRYRQDTARRLASMRGVPWSTVYRTTKVDGDTVQWTWFSDWK